MQLDSRNQLCRSTRRVLCVPAIRDSGRRRGLCQRIDSEETCDGRARFRLRAKTRHKTFPNRVPARRKNSGKSVRRNRRLDARTLSMMDFDTGVSVAPPPSSPSIASLSSRALQAREEIHTTGHRFSPEFDLLLACVACDKSARTENVREAICSNLEWQTLLRITGHHRLIPQMYSALCDVANLVPADVLDKLRCRYQANVRQTLRLTRDLIRVLHHFESRAIPVLAYKGPALASILHGDFAQ